jgi:VanZ family protein
MSELSPRRLLPPLVLMALIFLLSAQSDLDSGFGLPDLIGRKIVHFGTYALLAYLWWRGLAPATARALPIAAAISLLYAASDEWHQSFVAGRHGTPVDVLIDGAGIALACWLIATRLPTRR